MNELPEQSLFPFDAIVHPDSTQRCSLRFVLNVLLPRLAAVWECRWSVIRLNIKELPLSVCCSYSWRRVKHRDTVL